MDTAIINSSSSSRPRTGSLDAAQLESALKLKKAGCYEAALKQLSELDSAEAHFELADLYEKVPGLSEENYIQAIFNFKIAAMKGWPRAYQRIGDMYRDGRGVRQSHTYAKEAYEIGIEQGCIESQYSLGQLYYDGGPEFPQDYLMALSCFEKIAKQHGSAANAAGCIYDIGRGVAPDPVKAREFFSLAAQLNNPYGHINLGSMYRDGKIDSQCDFKLAFEHFKRALELSVELPTEEMNILKGRIFNYIGGLYCYAGDGIKKDFCIALDWLRQAVQHGCKDAYWHIGHIYRIGGYGIAQNHLEAIYHYKLLGPEWKDRVSAQYAKILSSAKSSAVPDNNPNGWNVLLKLNDAEYLPAILELGDIYRLGAPCVVQDYAKAVDYYSRCRNSTHEAEAIDRCLAMLDKANDLLLKNEDEDSLKEAHIILDALAYSKTPVAALAWGEKYLYKANAGYLHDAKKFQKAYNDFQTAASGTNDKVSGIANYKIATIFKSKIEEDDIPTYLERAYLKGHPDALNTMFELSEEYRNKYKSSILIRNDNDLKLANDLLDLAAKYNHPKALSMQAIFLSQLKLKAQLQTQEQIAKENAVAPKVQGIKPKDNPVHDEL